MSSKYLTEEDTTNECSYIDIYDHCVINCWERTINGIYCEDHREEMKYKTVVCQYYGCSFLCNSCYCERHERLRILENKALRYNINNSLCSFKRGRELCSKPSGKYKYCRECSQYFKNLKKK